MFGLISVYGCVIHTDESQNDETLKLYYYEVNESN